MRIKTILVINGVNLNLLGKRNRNHYGKLTLPKINKLLLKVAIQRGVKLVFFQSNYEGAIIDNIQQNTLIASGILINPGAFTHYSYGIRDALVDTNLPIVEVHLSDIDSREDFRKIDVLDGIVIKKISGLKEQSYIHGLELLIKHLQKNEN